MSRCEHARTVADALPGTLSPALEAHARRCTECAEELALSSALSRLGDREVAFAADRAPSLRDAVLARAMAERAAARPKKVRFLLFTGAAGAMAAAAALVFALRPAPEPAGPALASLVPAPVVPSPAPAAPVPLPAAPAVAMRANVRAEKDASFTHGRESGDERVVLEKGRIHLEVEHLQAGERFRVLTDDAEVEVRGTSFEVVAQDRRLISVRVESGVVDVRPSGHAPVTLTRGQSWAAEAQKPRAAPKRAKARTFDDAWDAMRAADYARAAELFASAESDGSAPPEDAAYGRAIALARAGLRDRAIDAMTTFVARYPAAPKKSSIAVQLGWLLVDAGKPTEAAAHFTTAQDDPAEPIRASARHGLATVRTKD